MRKLLRLLARPALAPAILTPLIDEIQHPAAQDPIQVRNQFKLRKLAQRDPSRLDVLVRTQADFTAMPHDTACEQRLQIRPDAIVNPEQPFDCDAQPGLLLDFARQAFLEQFADREMAARQVPGPRYDIDGARLSTRMRPLSAMAP
jgi:hypothetical protein